MKPIRQTSTAAGRQRLVDVKLLLSDVQIKQLKQMAIEKDVRASRGQKAWQNQAGAIADRLLHLHLQDAAHLD